MMTTSYPHSAVMHPQGMPPGHPMGGPGPNPGQQMPPGMQHVSGPNGPVSQAGPMMGMQPGMGGPNAHALSHLQPQQQQMFHQQQMMNPALLQQQRNAQQQAMMRHQAHTQMLAQQQGGMGMGMGFQNPMANMNPQQMAAFRASQLGQPFVNLPPHLQLQQQQQQMQNQQQGVPQAAALAQAQAQAQAHHQAQQQQMQQQAIAMQHAQSQSSNHSQPGNQGPPSTSQSQQGPLRPPSAIGSHQGQSSPAPQPTPQQIPQQPPPQPQQQPQPQQPQPQPPQQQTQQQPPQSGPAPQQQTPAPTQPQTLPQQPNHQGQNQTQMPQRNPAMAQQAQQQAHAQAQANAQVAANAQAVQARSLAMMKQAQPQPQTQGQGTLKLLNFVDQIGRYNANDKNHVTMWQMFVDKFFTETGSFVQIVASASAERTKQYEIVYAALPRYFYTLFNTDVTNLQITLDGATEKSMAPELKVTCERAKFIYTFRNQCQVVYSGKLTAFWSGSDKMEWLQFEGQSHQQYLSRAALEPLFHQPSPNQMNPAQSPRMNKAAKQKMQQQRAAMEPPEPYLPLSKLLHAGVNDWGLPQGLMGYLEIYETMNNMTSLMAHYLEHTNLKPSDALESWNTMMSSTSGAPNGVPVQNGGMPPGNMPPGARPPGAGQNGPVFMSPAMANQLLPNGAMSGSPGMMHTPSPASHAMIKQQSTSSHTASVNTSPSMNNKRRRSTIKMDDDGGGDVNGAGKVKQSPRVGGGKRMKAGGGG